ncbi:glycerate kinase [Leucobacter luti]|uniref:Glycerate kinase n=1 Tax=Leucobacter luti TaxID=340320 RepID=A0A4Q7U374_9MICO|nr:glycerate kinase [Leucobacter luti]MBL3699174.1 glycerate kinase [Leucobacter luti]RZT66672.1 glycerate kinase [Leucobacter luti]
MTAAQPRIVIAPDSLKGSCTAPAAAAALASGARAALGNRGSVREIPLADGGEGTLDALTAAWGGAIIEVRTADARGRARTGRIGLSADGRTAIIEAAEANGLPLVSDLPLRALDADSGGVGHLVRAAVTAGASELLLCLGGSATSDGGAGMLRELGARLLRADGRPVSPGARGLSEIAQVDLSAVPAAIAAARWRIAADVDNPLVGPRGAAAVFGPQKGASSAEIIEIDTGLRRLAEVLGAVAHTDRPGLGAAGGLALVPAALWGAELVPGAELVATAAGLDAALAGADLVITAEGRLDQQSLDGKVVSRVVAGAAAAEREGPAGTERRAPLVVVIAGSVALSHAECRAAGITAAFSIAPGPAALDELQADAPRLLAEAAAQACALAFPAH